MCLVEFSLAPLDQGESVGEFVARAVAIVAESGLDYRLHAMGTIIEGEWDEVMAVVKRCFDALKPDCRRITCSIKIDYRQGCVGRLVSKVKSVEQRVGKPLKTTETP